jgi:hypothetical protein
LKKELTGDMDGFKKYLIGLKIIFCFRNKGCSWKVKDGIGRWYFLIRLIQKWFQTKMPYIFFRHKKRVTQNFTGFDNYEE